MAGTDPLSAATTGAIAGLGVLTDPNLKSDLSPPAAALAKALDEGVGAALFGRSISSAGADALAGLAGDVAASVGENAAEIVGEVAQAVPLVGTVVKAAITFVSAMMTPFSEASQTEVCAHLAQVLAPAGTGSMLGGGRVVPADIFAPSFEVAACTDGHWQRTPSAKAGQVVATCAGGPLRARSLFGHVLMQITEGCPVDTTDPGWDWEQLRSGVLQEHPGAKSKGFATRPMPLLWERAVERDLHLAVRTYREQQDEILRMAGEEWRAKGVVEDPVVPPGAMGLPPAWRRRFRALRRGIEAAWGPGLAAGARSDGGVGLWVIYVDLLTEAFRRGYLSPYFATYLLARQARQGSYVNLGPRVTWDRLAALESDDELVRRIDLPAAPPTWLYGFQFDGPCPPMLIGSMVLPLVNGWADTVRPHYVQGAREVQRIQAAADPGVPWWAWVLGALGLGALAGGAVWAARQGTQAPQLPKDFEARFARRP
jgi:hypothetical protein